MPYNNTQVFDRLQGKIETTRGTAEATMTRWIPFVVGTFTWEWTAEIDETRETTRSFAPLVGPLPIGLPTVRITMEIIPTYEELVWWLNLALDGDNLAGTTTGSTPAGYTYTLVQDLTTDTIETVTLKYGDPGLCHKFSRGVVSRMTYRWNPQSGGEAGARLTIEMLAVYEGTSTFDSPVDTTRTKIESKGHQVYIDAIGGTIMTTPWTGYARSGEISIDNAIEEKVFSESIAGAAADFARNYPVISGSVLAEFKDDTEAAKARAGTAFKLAIVKTGATIGSTPTTTYKNQIQFPVAQWRPTLAQNWTGLNRTIPLSFMALVNASNPNPINWQVVNALASITA